MWNDSKSCNVKVLLSSHGPRSLHWRGRRRCGLLRIKVDVWNPVRVMGTALRPPNGPWVAPRVRARTAQAEWGHVSSLRVPILVNGASPHPETLSVPPPHYTQSITMSCPLPIHLHNLGALQAPPPSVIRTCTQAPWAPSNVLMQIRTPLSPHCSHHCWDEESWPQPYLSRHPCASPGLADIMPPSQPLPSQPTHTDILSLMSPPHMGSLPLLLSLPWANAPPPPWPSKGSPVLPIPGQWCFLRELSLTLSIRSCPPGIQDHSAHTSSPQNFSHLQVSLCFCEDFVSGMEGAMPVCLTWNSPNE